MYPLRLFGGSIFIGSHREISMGNALHAAYCIGFTLHRYFIDRFMLTLVHGFCVVLLSVFTHLDGWLGLDGYPELVIGVWFS